MNLFMITGAAQGVSAPANVLWDSCAFVLLTLGAASLLIAGYLLYKAPRGPLVRYSRGKS